MSLALLSSGGASLWERVPPVYALEFGASLAEFGAGGCYKGHLEPEPSWGGLQKASWSCSARVEAKPLERGRIPPKSSPVAQATNRALVARWPGFFGLGGFCGLGCAPEPFRWPKGAPYPV